MYDENCLLQHTHLQFSSERLLSGKKPFSFEVICFSFSSVSSGGDLTSDHRNRKFWSFASTIFLNICPKILLNSRAKTYFVWRRDFGKRCSWFFFKKLANPVLFFISFFSNRNLQKKTLGFSVIQTRIVGVEGEHSDHLTTQRPFMISILYDRYSNLAPPYDHIFMYRY